MELDILTNLLGILCLQGVRPGSTHFAGAKSIWKAWAPLKVKLFMWQAVLQQLWTADRW